MLGGLNAFYLLVDTPETYGLPSRPKLPSRSVLPSSLWAVFAALMTALGVLFSFRRRTQPVPAPVPTEAPPVSVSVSEQTPALGALRTIPPPQAVGDQPSQQPGRAEP